MIILCVAQLRVLLKLSTWQYCYLMLLVPPIINLMVQTGKKVKVYDLRPHNIARLRFAINQFDWATVLSCSDDVSFVYNQFLNSIKLLIESSLPTKTVKTS